MSGTRSTNRKVNGIAGAETRSGTRRAHDREKNRPGKHTRTTTSTGNAFPPRAGALPVAVDRFDTPAAPGVRFFFLTHAHSDHFSSLSRAQPFHGDVLCSDITARLMRLPWRRPLTHYRPLALNIAHVLEPGLSVTLLDANHCPGAVMLLFQCTRTGTVLWTGDCRADQALRASLEPVLDGPLAHLFLDTSCHRFKRGPPHHAAVARFLRDFEDVHARGDVAVFGLGAGLGTEIFVLHLLEDAPADVRIHASPGRIRELKALLPPRMHARLVNDERHAQLHLCRAECTFVRAWRSLPRTGRVHYLSTNFQAHSTLPELEALIRLTMPRGVTCLTDPHGAYRSLEPAITAAAAARSKRSPPPSPAAAAVAAKRPIRVALSIADADDDLADL